MTLVEKTADRKVQSVDGRLSHLTCRGNSPYPVLFRVRQIEMLLAVTEVPVGRLRQRVASRFVVLF